MTAIHGQNKTAAPIRRVAFSTQFVIKVRHFDTSKNVPGSKIPWSYTACPGSRVIAVMPSSKLSVNQNSTLPGGAARFFQIKIPAPASNAVVATTEIGWARCGPKIFTKNSWTSGGGV